MAEIPHNPRAAPDHDWRRSSYSIGANSTCVEVVIVGELVCVRDSKDIAGPALVYTTEEWRVFVRGMLAGEFDIARVT